MSNRLTQNEILDALWLGLGDTSGLTLGDPLAGFTTNPASELLRIFRNPDYFGFTCEHLLGVELFPFQAVMLRELWIRPFPMLVGSRGLGKSWLLGLYAVLRALLCQGVKVAIVGAGFRQAKVVFEYAEGFWANAPVLRDILGAARGRNDRENGPHRGTDLWELILGESSILALPLGNGEKIRGQRANYIMADEFNTIPVDIYENVVAGFAAVSADPVGNARRIARVEHMKKAGVWTEADELIESKSLRGNQSIIAATAHYAFNSFAAYWRRYKGFIESKGDRRKLGEIFGGEERIEPSFDWRDYSIMRIPVNLVPKGFMDERNVARSKATVHSAIYKMEYGALFVADSDGFFRRTLVESCVTGRNGKPLILRSGPVDFRATLYGFPHGRYVYGIDPAAMRDNFAIIILELHSDHRRVVHCWTTTKASHLQKLKDGVINEKDYYRYCARRLRDLFKLFPPEHLAMDSQGGGFAVAEALQDDAHLEEGEDPVLPVVNPDKEQDSDFLPGMHLLEMVNFADAAYTAHANHGLRKDFEDKVVLFPASDTVLSALAFEEDQIAGRKYDTLEECYAEIEELKDELASIVMTQTPSGKDHFDTPDAKIPGGKRGRLRKDRYTALLMANMAARIIAATPPPQAYNTVGGFAHMLSLHGKPAKQGQPYFGNEWLKGYGGGQVVRRS